MLDNRRSRRCKTDPGGGRAMRLADMVRLLGLDAYQMHLATLWPARRGGAVT